MNDFRTLKFFDLFRGLFKRFGINYPVLRKILHVKLTMDQRRVPTILNQSNKKNKKDKNHFLASLWTYALMGLFILPFILLGDSYFFQMSIAFGIIMFIVMTSMISDFSSVLLDLRDRNILSTKPIDRRTIATAKALHIFIYLFFLTTATIAIPLIVGIVKHGVAFFIIFFVAIILIDLLIVVLTAMIYLLILKFFDGEKLKDIINYVQIGLSIAMVIGYQLLGRSFELLDTEITLVPQWWQYVIPPFWFGAPFELFLNGNKSSNILAFTSLAIVVPIISMFLYSKLMPTFERNLQKLANHSVNKKGARKRKQPILGKWIFRNKEEQAFFHFASYMMKNEREFRLKVYPSLGFSLIFPFIFIFNNLQISSFSEVAASNSYFNIYFSALMIPSAIIMLKYSGKYKGAWIYMTTPIKDYGFLYSGTLKAFFIKLFLPVYVVLSFIFIGIFGLRILADLFVVLFSALLYVVVCYRLIKGTLPFSESFSALESGGLKTLPYMLIIGVMWGAHYLIGFLFDGAIYLYLFLLIIANLVTWRKLF